MTTSLHDTSGLWRRMRVRWTQHLQLAQTRRALFALPDAALRDIGLHRSEIGGIANLQRLNNRL